MPPTHRRAGPECRRQLYAIITQCPTTNKENQQTAAPFRYRLCIRSEVSITKLTRRTIYVEYPSEIWHLKQTGAIIGLVGGFHGELVFLFLNSMISKFISTYVGLLTELDQEILCPDQYLYLEVIGIASETDKPTKCSQRHDML